MQKTQMMAEKAATKASRTILRGIDKIHRLNPEEIRKQTHNITRITEKHIFDCYINSWLEEAEELEDLFGDILLASFLIRLYQIELFGPDRQLVKEATEYVRRVRCVVPIYKHFIKYQKQLEDIKIAPKRDQKRLREWRTGKYGESGLGYSLISLLRTESDAAQVEASASVYEKAGIPAYRFNAMMDDKTCEICGQLHGKTFLLSERQPGVNYPIIHPNCRCYIEPVML